MKKENKGSKSKYTIFTLIICVIAVLSGKPISEVLSDVSSTQENTSYEQTYEESEEVEWAEEEISDHTFRSQKLLDDHYEKHGLEMGFDSPEEYVENANRVISSPDVLYKREAEDNDHVYYLEETNEFVVVSEDGYIRTYFNPSAGIDYFNRQ